MNKKAGGPERVVAELMKYETEKLRRIIGQIMEKQEIKKLSSNNRRSIICIISIHKIRRQL